MSDTTVEQSDVAEITHRADLISERVKLVRNKAFLLRNLAKPKPEGESGKIRPVGDFSSEIKDRLDHIQRVLDEAIESLSLFAG